MPFSHAAFSHTGFVACVVASAATRSWWRSHASGAAFCPSSGARRMAETAAHLVDRVIPAVPVRQWVLSLPIPLRILFAAQPQLLAPLLQVTHRVIAGFLVKRRVLNLAEPTPAWSRSSSVLDQPPI